MMYFETLESRTFLAAGPGSSLATAIDLGSIAGIKASSGAVSPKQTSQYYRLSVGGTGNVNVTMRGLLADADLQLLDRRGRVLGSSIKPARRAESISTSLKAGTYYVRVFSATKKAQTTYNLAIQADLNWGYAVSNGKRMPVGLIRADGSTKPINPNAETWILVHGMNGTPDYLTPLGKALQKHSKSYQVLMLDWSKPASQGLFTSFNWVPYVAQFVANSLSRWGVPGSKVDLIGHSMGGDVIAYVAEDVSGGVNRIVGLDPATEWPLESIDYAAHSQYSVAFVGSSLSTPVAALTADATFHTDVGDYNSPLSHMAVADLFTGMMQADNTASPDPVSALFAPEQLSPTATHPWKLDAYSGGYEGTIVGEGSILGGYSPKSIQYVDATTGQTVKINA